MLAAGTILTRGTPVYDVVKGVVYKATTGQPLIIPEGAQNEVALEAVAARIDAMLA